jgi:hypothetical protein
MKRTFTLLIMTVAGLTVCMESQQPSPQYSNSAQFTDSHIYHDFLEKLDGSGVKYRKDKDHFVFYSASENKVQEISAALVGKYYPGCGVSFTDKAGMELVKRELKDQGIPFNCGT